VQNEFPAAVSGGGEVLKTCLQENSGIDDAFVGIGGLPAKALFEAQAVQESAADTDAVANDEETNIWQNRDYRG